MIRPNTAALTMMLTAGGTMLLPGQSVRVVAQVVLQPFYLEQTTSTLHADTGVFGPDRTKTVARRADGVTVVVDGFGPTSFGKTRKVMTPDGIAVTVWQNVKLKTTWPAMSDWEAAALADQLKTPSPECRPNHVGYDDNGQPSESNERFLRFDTTANQRVAVFEAGLERYVITVWRAPALACQELYYTSERIKADGSRLLSLERTTTQFQLGEPDAGLFAIDADYEESKPSVALEALIQTIGTPSPPKDEAEFEAALRREGEMMDRLYLSLDPRGCDPNAHAGADRCGPR
jgi:hypothetical protein